MTKKQPKEFIVELKPFRAGISFVVSDKQHFVKYMEACSMDYHVEESDLKDGKCIYEFGGKWLPIIWIDSTKSKKEQLGILVHEITHAIYWMMSDREIAHNLDTDEVYAYIHQYFFNEAYENL